jgi:hypothetical protein
MPLLSRRKTKNTLCLHLKKKINNNQCTLIFFLKVLLDKSKTKTKTNSCCGLSLHMTHSGVGNPWRPWPQ